MALIISCVPLCMLQRVGIAELREGRVVRVASGFVDELVADLGQVDSVDQELVAAGVGVGDEGRRVIEYTTGPHRSVVGLRLEREALSGAVGQRDEDPVAVFHRHVVAEVGEVVVLVDDLHLGVGHREGPAVAEVALLVGVQGRVVPGDGDRDAGGGDRHVGEGQVEGAELEVLLTVRRRCSSSW